MAYTLALDVNIGDYTKASNHDNLSTNVDYLQVLADVQHNFNITTGTGYHKAITQLITDAAGATVKDLLLSEWDPGTGVATIGQAIRYILGKMPDSANNQDIYGALRIIADNVTSTSEEGRVVLALMAAGTLTDQIEILKNAVRPTTDSALSIGSASQRLLGVFTDTLGDSGQALSVLAAGMHTAIGAVMETNLATPRRVEFIQLTVIWGQGNGSAGVDDFCIRDGSYALSGTSINLTAGFHTTAAVVAAYKNTSSVGDTDANRVFLDGNAIRIKKTSGSAVNRISMLSVSRNYSAVDLSSIHGFDAETIAADANFTGSPSSIQFVIYNASGAAIDPFSLVSSDGQMVQLVLSGAVIL